MALAQLLRSPSAGGEADNPAEVDRRDVVAFRRRPGAAPGAGPGRVVRERLPTGRGFGRSTEQNARVAASGRSLLPCLLAGAAVTAGLRAAPQLQDADVIEGRRVEDGRLRLRWENDSWFSNSDRFYTNGTGIGWTLPDGPTADAAAAWLDWLPMRAPRISGTATELFLAQEMFTPEDTRRQDVVLDDRPYAGWLHVDLRHQILALDRSRRHDMLDTWLLQVGVVGPSSQAGDTQIQVHEVVDAPRPQGWRNQLHDEPGLVLGFRRDFRAFHDPRWVFGMESDFEGHYGLHVGNVDTSGRIGAQVRVGWHLPRHFDTAIRSRETDDRHRFFLTAGMSGRVVARDIFLDGNTWRDSHSIGRNYLVADFHVALHWEPCWFARVSVARVFRTPEFDSPSTRGDLSSFMTVQFEFFF